MKALKSALRRLILVLESACESVFGARFNPVTQLGTLGWYLFWIVTVSGIYVYVFFDTGVTQAWESLERLSRDQWWLGGIMRSLHRYASDGLVIVVILHLVREFAMDRLRGNRWFPWVTGVPLLWFLYACGITGYWLVWDELAQYVAVTTTEWLDSIGVFAEPIARNFVDSSRLSGRFFTLMAYIHIAVPLLMLLFMWIHISRHAHARVNPPRELAIGTLAALIVLSLVHPAMSQSAANLDRVPFSLGFDWFYLAVYPLIDRVGGANLWLALVGGSVLLTLLPWLPPLKKPAPARVDLANCNGCSRCFADCPFGAINMVHRTDGLAFDQEARVDADLCMSCGICVGACPTATPFRRAGALSAGIELPERTIADLREEVIATGARLTGDVRVIAFGCAHDAGSDALADASTGVVKLPCVGMLPPSFLDFVLSRKHAEGVLIAGCAEHDCFERLGDQWTVERIANERDPHLRDRVPRERVALALVNAGRPRLLADSLAKFRAHLRQFDPTTSVKTKSAWRPGPISKGAALRYVGQGVVYAAVALLIGNFATRPALGNLGTDEGVLTLSFSHAGQPLKPCRRYTPEELAKMKFSERRPTSCERGRWPIRVELDVDGQPLYRGDHAPAGLWDDGPSSVHRRFRLPAGHHRVDVRMRDDGNEGGYRYVASQDLMLEPGENFVVDFEAGAGGFVFDKAGRASGTRGTP